MLQWRRRNESNIIKGILDEGRGCGGVVNGSRLFFLRNRGEGVVLGIQSFDLVEDPLILLIRRTHLFMGSL